MIDLSDVATTAKDLTPLLRSFREPIENNAQRIVDASWLEIMEELELLAPNEDAIRAGLRASPGTPRRMGMAFHARGRGVDSTDTARGTPREL